MTFYKSIFVLTSLILGSPSFAQIGSGSGSGTGAGAGASGTANNGGLGTPTTTSIGTTTSTGGNSSGTGVGPTNTMNRDTRSGNTTSLQNTIPAANTQPGSAAPASGYPSQTGNR